MFYRLLFAGLAFITFITTTHSQSYVREVYTRFVNIGTSNGLSNNIVNDIVQDKRGFMWFATENGLSRFDGYEYLNYYHDPADSLSIPGNIITSLSTDNQDNLWIGTTEGLCRLSLKDDHIERFKAKPGDINTPRTNHIRKILFSERNSTLWIETFEGTLSAYNLSSGNWEHFSHIAPSQPYYRYHALFEDSRGNIWFGGRNTPVMRFDIDSKSIKSYNALGEEVGSKRDNDVGAIFETSNNEWFVTGLDGVYRFYPETEGFKKIYATSTYDIEEDNNGIIWFATGNGLLSLDTFNDRFRHYVYDQYNPMSLTNNRVNCVYVDKDNNIWAGTNNGVSLLSRKSSTFNYYYNIPGTNNSLSSNNVSSIAQDKKGIIYIGTADQGLNIWKYGENNFRRMKSDPGNPCAISSDRVSALYVDSYNKLWTGLWAGIGFDIYDSEYDCFQRYTYDKASLKRDWYNAFLEVNDGNMLAGMWGAFGAIYFDRDSKEFTQKHFYKSDKPYNGPVDRIINNNGSFFFISEKYPAIFVSDIKSNKYSAHIYDDAFQPDEQNPVGQYNNLPFSFEKITAVSTSGDGLSLFATDKGIIGHNNEKGFFKIYKAELNPVSIDVNEKFIFVLEAEYLHIIDRNTKKVTGIKSGNDIFIIVKAVDDSSVIITGNNNSLYYVHLDDYGNTPGIKRSDIINPLINITSIHADNNTLWLGSQNGLHYYDLNKLFERHEQKVELNQLLDIPVTAVSPDLSSSLLVFTSVGIYSVDIYDNKIANIILDNTPKDFNTAAYSATMVNSDTVWIGNENGHYQIALRTGEVINTNAPTQETVSSRLTTCLLQDFDGNLWIGTSDKGLSRVDKNTGLITHFYEESDKNKIPGNSVNAIIQASDGKIWIATNKGLAYIKNNKVEILGGITDKLHIYSLEEALSGRIWAASDAGLLTIKENGKIGVFDESFGVPNIEFTTASSKLINDHLAFGTSKGFYTFDPGLLEASMEDNTYDVWINKFTVFDKPYRYNFKRNDTLELHYSENFFQISFSAASYGIKPGVKYRYKLIGVDPDWVETTENKVSYTGVPPGNYKFKICTISSADNVRDEYFASLMIMIPPPYYQTVWFRVTVFLILFLAIASYMFIYIRQLKTSRLNIELNQKLLASQMNPHFIFNSLSAIQSFMYTNKPEEAGNFLSSFSRLIRLILENTRSEFIPIKQEIKTLELYLEIQKLRFCDKLDYKINASPGLRESDMLVPPMLAQPFIENSIEHGILHKKGNGFVEVFVELQNSSIVMIIQDDGIGIESAKQLKKQMSHISHSTSITKDRIKNLSHRKNNDYGIKIVDLKYVGKQGTRVELKYPCK